MVKKILFLVSVITIVFLLYHYVGVVRNSLDKLLLPGSLKEYSYLYENKSESMDYRITKIFDDSFYENIRFHTSTKEFLLEIPDSDYDRNNQGWKTFWKISKEGKIVDSLSSRDYMNDVGIFLDSTTYIDWVHSGTKEPQKYQQIFNYDSIANSEFTAFVRKAEIIAFGSNYEKKTTNCYLKIEGEWFVFESKEAFKEDFYSREEDFFKHKPKGADVFMSIENQVMPFQEWKDENQFIYLEDFVAESRQFKPMFDFNNHGRSGWNGTGYYRLNYNSNAFYFKGYTFKGSSFSPDMSFYNLHNTKAASDSDISFLIVGRNNNSKADIREKGVYVISKKN